MQKVGQQLYGLLTIIPILIIIWCSILILVLGACMPTFQQDSLSPTQVALPSDVKATKLTPTTQVSGNAIVTTPANIVIEEPTNIPIEATATLHKTTESTLQTEATIPSAFPAGLQEIAGSLFLYTPTSIQKIAIADGEREYLLSEQDDWLDWGADFAKNSKNAVYWIRYNGETEIWFTQLPEWAPELLLKLKEIEYDFLTPMWGVNDQYLLINLSVVDNSGPLEDIRTVATYIIDMQTMQLISSPYWPGDCSILAYSPQTNDLALWCYQLRAESDSQDYFVLEPNADPWLTQQVPETLIDDCLIYLVCAWSHDGEHVAYVVTEKYPQLLFYTPVNDDMPIHLDDELSRSYSFPAWSPNNQFLSYAGACEDGGIQCPNVMSILDKEVVWRAKDGNNQSEMGNFSPKNLVWSPNSRYLAIPTLDLGPQIIIFDLITLQEIGRVSSDVVSDMVWVMD